MRNRNRFSCLAALLALLTAFSTNAEIIIPRGSVWKYHNLNTDLGTAWRQRGYDDSTWASGPGPSGAGDAHIVTTIDFGATTRYPTIYFRRSFTITNVTAYRGLTLRVLRDDGAIVYLNGVQVQAVNVNTPIGFSEYTGIDAGNATDEMTYFEFSLPTTALTNGVNVFAVEGKQATSTSSDFGFDLELEGLVDQTPPTIVSRTPPSGGIVPQLNSIQISFSEDVTNVDAGDLLINNVPATNMSFAPISTYTFQFVQPATGLVNVAFAPGHGIADLSVPPNAFAGANWIYTLDPNVVIQPFIISEFLAANSGNQSTSIRDEDGDSSDWIEIFNPRATAGDIGGWFLTDTATNLTKWRIPNGVSVPARGYLIVFASGKNRTNATSRLHTNFQLNNSGEFLGLLDPNANIVSQFAPVFPPQSTDISYGRDRGNPNLVGYYVTPTPGADNATTGTGFGSNVHFSRNGGTFVGSFQLTLTADDTNAVIRYELVNTAGSFFTATNVPTENSPRYTGPITINNTVQVRARAFSTNANFFPGPPHSESYIAVSGAISNFTSTLPIVVIHTLAATNISAGYPAADNSVVIACFDNDSSARRSSLLGKPQLVKRAGINYRGSSTQFSSTYPKGSWAVELWDEFNDDDSASMLGLPSESDWVLYAPNIFDPTGLHNPIMYQFGRDVGQYTSRIRFVEVFYHNGSGPVTADINSAGPTMGDYWGIYVLEEKVKVDNNRLDIDRLEPEVTNAPAITGGYLIKIDRVDSNERTFSAGGQTLIYQDPDGLEMVTASRARQASYLTGYINLFNTAISGSNLTNALGTNHYSAYLDIPITIDLHIINVMVMNLDAYRLSGFMYKPRNGKLVMGPLWDVDRGMGTTAQNGDWRAFNPRAWQASNPLSGGSDYGTDFFQGATTPSWWGRFFADPDFWQAWIDRYQELRTSIFDTNRIAALVDDLADEIREAQPREARRWAAQGNSNTSPRSGVTTTPNGDYTYNFPGTFQGEVDFQKVWFYQHVHFMDTNLLNRPVLTRPEGPVASGTVVTIADNSGKPGTKIYYTLDGSDPRAPQGRTNSAAREYTGPITITNNVRIRARAVNENHRNLTGITIANSRNPVLSSPWSGDIAATYYVSVPALRITELMFNPVPTPGFDTNDADNFEYIEMKNVGATALNLSGFKFINGVSFDFTGGAVTTLAPGGYVLVVKNLAAFTMRYGSRTNIAGEFNGNLDNSGERITLVGPRLEPILDFTYNDTWYPAADGSGFSLITANENAPVTAWDSKSNWRASHDAAGSPGVADPAPRNFPAVVVNEVATRIGGTISDIVELWNMGTNTAEIGGWYLTDDPGKPQRSFIPVGTTIGPNEFLLFQSTNQFPGLTNRYSTNAIDFALDLKGEAIYLFSAADGNLTGYSHGFDFGAAEENVTFGRYVNSQGAEHFVAQSRVTIGESNALPKVGPVVISEIMYRPPDAFANAGYQNNSRDEFIELRNVTASPVNLFSATNPSVTWKLDQTVEFDFPTNTTIPANGYLLVVNFSPSDATQLAAFRAKYGVSASVPIVGPYRGSLDNSRGNVSLYLADTSRIDGNVRYVLVDRVQYADEAPWPSTADGFGHSLNRLVLTAYGNDPTNWVAGAPTPGGALSTGVGPTIVVHPSNQSVLATRTATFTGMATGAGTIRYQWRYNGALLNGATNGSLVLSNVQTTQAGEYQFVALNEFGSTASGIATLTIAIPATIVQQPVSLVVSNGQDAAFSVQATTTKPPLSYQWFRNGFAIAAAINSALLLTNVSEERDAGEYVAAVTDATGTIFTTPATLTVLLIPTMIQPVPPVRITAVVGETITLGAQATGSRPMLYRWRRVLTNGASLIVANHFTNSSVDFLTVPNIATAFDGAYFTLTLTNAAYPAQNRTYTNAFLTVLADSNANGIPDVWESAYFGSPTGASRDADSDGDGMSNYSEYIAGTNPTNAASYLKVNGNVDTGIATITFEAVSNRTYSVLYKDELSTPVWSFLADVVARNTNWSAVVTDPRPGTNRFYRIATPKQP